MPSQTRTWETFLRNEELSNRIVPSTVTLMQITPRKKTKGEEPQFIQTKHKTKLNLYIWVLPTPLQNVIDK